jgi:cytochrome c oxidase cbb3-type subunit 3
MATERHDPVTGRPTTGHEWNGIEELETPIPRVVIFFLIAGTLFAIGYWLQAAVSRAVWTDRIATEDFAAIAADEDLMRHVRDTGRTLFVDNCAVCHGVRGTGGPGFPNLAAGSWLWGGDPETIAETINVGINSTDEDTRISQMMAFGRDGMLEIEDIRSVAAYVRSLSGQQLGEADQARLPAGQEVFAANCASCHGEEGKGMVEVGAPDLTDDNWIYGGDAQSVFTTIYSGRQGHMPHWQNRLSPTDIRILALYVGTLAEGDR